MRTALPGSAQRITRSTPAHATSSASSKRAPVGQQATKSRFDTSLGAADVQVAARCRLNAVAAWCSAHGAPLRKARRRGAPPGDLRCEARQPHPPVRRYSQLLHLASPRTLAGRLGGEAACQQLYGSLRGPNPQLAPTCHWRLFLTSHALDDFRCHGAGWGQRWRTRGYWNTGRPRTPLRCCR